MKPMFDSIVSSDSFGNEQDIDFKVQGISKFSQIVGKVGYKLIIRNDFLRRIYFRSKGMNHPEF